MKDDDYNPDPNENAARIVAESTTDSDAADGDLEAAWAEWSSHIQGVDERGMTLLKAAFEAGYEAGQIPDAAALGRRGGKKGGDARARKLSPKERSDIARRAARARWDDKPT